MMGDDENGQTAPREPFQITLKGIVVLALLIGAIIGQVVAWQEVSDLRNRNKELTAERSVLEARRSMAQFQMLSLGEELKKVKKDADKMQRDYAKRIERLESLMPGLIKKKPESP